MKGDMLLHFVHISGKRMIECEGIDLSKNYSTKGIMQEGTFVLFLPLYKLAIDQIGGLIIQTEMLWLHNNPRIYLNHHEWYSKSFSHRGCYF